MTEMGVGGWVGGGWGREGEGTEADVWQKEMTEGEQTCVTERHERHREREVK